MRDALSDHKPTWTKRPVHLPTPRPTISLHVARKQDLKHTNITIASNWGLFFKVTPVSLLILLHATPSLVNLPLARMDARAYSQPVDEQTALGGKWTWPLKGVQRWQKTVRGWHCLTGRGEIEKKLKKS